MRKDKEWLKEKVQHIATKLSLDDRLTGDVEDDIAEVVEAIDQLEEPEMNHSGAHDLLRKDSNLPEKTFDFYWNAIAGDEEMDKWSKEQARSFVPQFSMSHKKRVIKNVIRRLDDSIEFDETVNNALKEGFSLIGQTEVLRPMTSDKRTMLIARLEKWVEVE